MKKKLIAVSVLISLLVSSLAVIASSLQPNDSPYPSNTLRIIEIGLDEGDRKLAYLLGDKNVVDGVSATNLDYEELIKNPDDLKKYASLVSNFEITGDDVEIDYTTEITDDTPSDKIYKQHGYLELATDDNYDYMSKYYLVEDPSTEKVYLDGVEIGVLSDFDFSEVYRKDSISDIYNKSDVGTYVKIGDYYYDLLNSECMLYKDENMDSTYELDTITPDDYVYMTLYGHVAYTGLWKDLDRYVLSDLYIEDENGDYVCLKNGYENLLNYTISSINTLDDSNIKELDTSKDILLFNKTNNSLVYDGKLSDVSYNVLNNDFLFVIGSKTYNLKNLIGYYLDTVDDTTENIVLKDSYSNIAYLGSKAGLKRYKEDYSKVFKKDKNGSYIKFIKDGSEIYYDLKSLT